MCTESSPAVFCSFIRKSPLEDQLLIVGLKIFLGAIGIIYLILLVWMLKRRHFELKKGEVEDAVSKY